MTEEEAKTKWCPFSRVIAQDRGRLVQGSAAPNRINWIGEESEAPVGSLCIASACMAWRWHEAARTEAYKAATVAHMKATGDTLSKALQETLKRRDEFTYTEGYCGLAGQP